MRKITQSSDIINYTKKDVPASSNWSYSSSKSMQSMHYSNSTLFYELVYKDGPYIPSDYQIKYPDFSSYPDIRFKYAKVTIMRLIW